MFDWCCSRNNVVLLVSMWICLAGVDIVKFVFHVYSRVRNVITSSMYEVPSSGVCRSMYSCDEGRPFPDVNQYLRSRVQSKDSNVLCKTYFSPVDLVYLAAA